VQRQLTLNDALGIDRLGDELLGQLTGLGFGDDPPDDVTREDVDDDEQLVVDAPLRAGEFGVGVGPERPSSIPAGGLLRPVSRTGRAASTAMPSSA
jgi:hypothetical protein